LKARARARQSEDGPRRSSAHLVLIHGLFRYYHAGFISGVQELLVDTQQPQSTSVRWTLRNNHTVHLITTRAIQMNLQLPPRCQPINLSFLDSPKHRSSDPYPYLPHTLAPASPSTHPLSHYRRQPQLGLLQYLCCPRVWPPCSLCRSRRMS
jgi:hypothetical protein